MLPYPLLSLHATDLLVIWSIYNNPASPTTDQDISDDTLYSPTGSMNRATGECLYRGELGYPVKGTQENQDIQGTQEEQDNLETGYAALYRQLFTDLLLKQLRNKRS